MKEKNNYPDIFHLIFVYIIMVFVCAFACCTTTKHTSKETTKDEKQTDLVTVSNTTVTEQGTGTISVPGSTLSAEKEIDAVLKGDSAYTATPTETITTKVIQGKIVTRDVKKQLEIPNTFTRTSVTSATVNEHAQEKSTSVKAEKEVNRVAIAKPINLNYLWWLLLLLLIPAWKYRRVLFKSLV